MYYQEPASEGMTMAGMGKHSRLTKGQRWLAYAIAGLALAVAPLFFTVMFITVNDMLGPFFDGWAWAVPVATELSFTILFLLGILLAWADRAPGWLLLAPFPFMAASLWLNVYAGGSAPGMVGHGVVTVAFFVPLLALKGAIRRFTVTEEDRRRAVAVADAIAHARDILRAALGPFWRVRVPVLLRRQLRSRRLPAAVLEEIRQGVILGGASRWEPAVEAWITRSLALPEGVSALLAAARAEASGSALQGDSRGASARAAVVTPEVPLVVAPNVTPGPTPKVTPKTRRVVPAKASNDVLADLILEHSDDPAALNSYQVNKILKAQCANKGVGEERAKLLADLAQRRHRGHRVVAIGERR